MNIFVLDEDPIVAASCLVDRHTVKMVLESAQMLANCYTDNQLAAKDCPRTKTGNVRKHSYYNHPCSKWVRETTGNIKWLCEHAEAIDVERMERYGTEPHFSIEFIRWAYLNRFESCAEQAGVTPFALAMPDEYKQDNAVEAYRDYYRYGKKHLHEWKRNRPDWIDKEK